MSVAAASHSVAVATVRHSVAVATVRHSVAVATVAAVGVRGIHALLEATVGPATDDRWTRTNYRGRAVTLFAGPAFTSAALVVIGLDQRSPGRVRAAAVVAGAAATIAGGYDDLRGSSSARGLRGHFRAVGRGELTTGAVKVAAIGLGGLAAGCLAEPGRWSRKLGAGVVVAAAANLANLLDLRPGRVGKAGLLAAVPLVLSGGAGAVVAAAAGGAAAGLLPADLGERTMLGDTGANTLGALIGVAVIAGGRAHRLRSAMAVLVGLTAASEVVSFSRVIDASPPLRWLDQLGRRDA